MKTRSLSSLNGWLQVADIVALGNPFFGHNEDSLSQVDVGVINVPSEVAMLNVAFLAMCLLVGVFRNIASLKSGGHVNSTNRMFNSEGINGVPNMK